MAMIDYGSVVKKNGKIIQTHFFENFSTLKYKNNYTLDEEGNIIPDPDYIDETIVTIKRFKFDDDLVRTNEIEEVKESMAGNFFSLIGDKENLIGFYKQYFVVAHNMIIDWEFDEFKEQAGCSWYDYWHSHKKPITIDFKGFGKIKFSKIDKDEEYFTAFIADFTYKGDRYEVLFGYGIDPKVKYSEIYFNKYEDRRKLRDIYKFFGIEKRLRKNGKR